MPIGRRPAFNVHLLRRRVRWSALPRQVVQYGWRALVAVAPLVVARLLPQEGDASPAATVGGGLLSGALGLFLVVRPFIETVRQGVSIDLGGLIRAAPYQKRISELAQFKAHFNDMVQLLTGGDGRLVVIIDDLDRCPPERLVGVLDSIKVFMDSPGTAYILGLDRRITEQAVEQKYQDYANRAGEAREYLEKIVQLPFDLPPLSGEQMQVFVGETVLDLPDPRCTGVFALGLEPNLRKVKRTIYTYLLFWQLAQQKGLEEIKPVRLAKILVIRHSYPDFYALVQAFPTDLARLEAYLAAVEQGAPERAASRELADAEVARAETALTELSARLEPFRDSPGLRRLLTLHIDEAQAQDTNFADLSRDEIRAYITLTRTVREGTRAAALPREVYDPELVHVPPGRFRMGTSDEEIEWLLQNTDWAAGFKGSLGFEREQPAHDVHLPEYWIGRHPVTNAEYAAFVQTTQRDAPEHWEGGEYPAELSDHPVVNMSWHDAVAYCEWLSGKSGRNYRLPTEAEWERAAGWEVGAGKQRRYPWGDGFDPEKCNTQEAGPGTTTPVGQYSPDGDSPCGAADMAGNVWEWCQDWFAWDYYRRSPTENPPGPEGGTHRVLRGGSWSNSRGGARCAVRLGYDPD
jgi:formylglycine-generating enzyme required for sulfatase activity